METTVNPGNYRCVQLDRLLRFAVLKHEMGAYRHHREILSRDLVSCNHSLRLPEAFSSHATMLPRMLPSRRRFGVALTIRPATIAELPGLSDLCFRSKAVWGYDEAFMEACRGELSFDPRDLESTPIAVAEHDGKPIGVAQLKVVDGEADLLKLFVEPSALRSGTGKVLLAWAIDVAKKQGATRLTIEADPGAAAFYRRVGAFDGGPAPVRSGPGRMLPKLAMNLCRAD